MANIKTTLFPAEQCSFDLCGFSHEVKPTCSRVFEWPVRTIRNAGLQPNTYTEVSQFRGLHLLLKLIVFSISQNNIDFVDINASGEWLAFGASKLGQLLVWEWQSESYILKQQGHFDSMNSIVYSPDGQRIITTADDGKIKVWDVNSGFCIVTFTEHTSGVTACEFAKRSTLR